MPSTNSVSQTLNNFQSQKTTTAAAASSTTGAIKEAKTITTHTRNTAQVDDQTNFIRNLNMVKENGDINLEGKSLGIDELLEKKEILGNEVPVSEGAPLGDLVQTGNGEGANPLPPINVEATAMPELKPVMADGTTSVGEPGKAEVFTATVEENSVDNEETAVNPIPEVAAPAEEAPKTEIAEDICIVSIIVKDRLQSAEKINKVFTEFGDLFQARLGLPLGADRKSTVIVAVIKTSLPEDLQKMDEALKAIPGINTKYINFLNS